MLKSCTSEWDDGYLSADFWTHEYKFAAEPHILIKMQLKTAKEFQAKLYFG